MPRKDYVPAKDAQVDDFLATMGVALTSTPTAFGVDGGAVSSFVTLQAAFSGALAVPRPTPRPRPK